MRGVIPGKLGTLKGTRVEWHQLIDMTERIRPGFKEHHLNIGPLGQAFCKDHAGGTGSNDCHSHCNIIPVSDSDGEVGAPIIARGTVRETVAARRCLNAHATRVQQAAAAPIIFIGAAQ